MTIDWNLASNVAVPIITLFLGIWLTRRFEQRPALVSYFSHVAAFRVARSGGQPPLLVNTHAVVLRNTGRRSATNVRLRHNVLPDFVIWPAVQHHTEDLPEGGGREIVIPILVPKEQIWISYLYFAPLTYDQVNSGIRSDEGFAQSIPVLLQRHYPRWLRWSVTALMFIGIVTILYGVIEVAVLFFR